MSFVPSWFHLFSANLCILCVSAVEFFHLIGAYALREKICTLWLSGAITEGKPNADETFICHLIARLRHQFSPQICKPLPPRCGSYLLSLFFAFSASLRWNLFIFSPPGGEFSNISPNSPPPKMFTLAADETIFKYSNLLREELLAAAIIKGSS